jgi:hypothetical protein
MLSVSKIRSASKFEDMISWAPDRWREAFARAMAGEVVRFDEDETRLDSGTRWYNWEARPWRNGDSEIVGVVATATTLRAGACACCSRRERAASDARLADRPSSIVWEVDFKTRSINWHGDVEALYNRAVHVRTIHGEPHRLPA